MCLVEMKEMRETDRATIISNVVENVVHAARSGASPKDVVYIDLESKSNRPPPQQRARTTPSPPPLPVRIQKQPFEADLSTDSSDSDVLGIFLVDQVRHRTRLF